MMTIESKSGDLARHHRSMVDHLQDHMALLAAAQCVVDADDQVLLYPGDQTMVSRRRAALASLRCILARCAE